MDGVSFSEISLSKFENPSAAAIDQSGKIYTWGPNMDGQLGQGDFTQRILPTQIAQLKRKTITQVSIGEKFVVALGKNVSLESLRKKKEAKARRKRDIEQKRQEEESRLSRHQLDYGRDAKLPERELIGCQDLYQSAEQGDKTAIYEISSSRFTDYNSSEKCKKYELKLNINTAKMRLEEYDTNIRSWERKYNFKSSYEAEETFSRANWKTDKNDEFYKNGKNYIQMRFTRGALKQLLGIREGTCRDINSYSGWGSNIQWIKYRWGYYNNVCPKS